MALKKSFEFFLMTWEGILLQKSIKRLHVESLEGEQDILPGHQPFVVVLKPGVLTYYEENFEKATQSYRIQEGMLFLQDGKVTLCTSQVLMP
jgi:F0F1-type ATP synthase epsilon subunit